MLGIFCTYPPSNSFCKFGVKIVLWQTFHSLVCRNSTTGHCFEFQISDSFLSREGKLVICVLAVLGLSDIS